MPPRNKIEVMPEHFQIHVRKAIWEFGFRRFGEVAEKLRRENGIDVDVGVLSRYAKKNFKRPTSVVICGADGKTIRIHSFSEASEIQALIVKHDEGKV